MVFFVTFTGLPFGNELGSGGLIFCIVLLHLLIPDNSSKAAKYYLKCGNVYKNSAKASA